MRIPPVGGSDDGRRGVGGDLTVKCRRRVSPRNRDDEVKNTRGIFKVRCTVHKGHRRPKRGVTNVVNTQDSQEQAPCATYGFLGLIQVPYEAPVYNVGLPKDR